MDVSANNAVSGDAFVVGVDFGTLSARALVVRVRDGEEAGTAVSEYSRGVIDRSLDGHGDLPPDWALQDPGDYTAALGDAVPAAIRDAGIDPGQVIGIATDFTASTCMPVTADGTPLCQLPGLAARPHAYPKLWKHHAAQPHADRINAARPRAPGEVDQPLRREDLLGVAVRQGPAATGRGPRDVPARRPLDRGGRLDRLAAVRDRDQERLHRRVQGHLPGRQLPVAGVPGRARPAASPALPRTSSPIRFPRWAPGPGA